MAAESHKTALSLFAQALMYSDTAISDCRKHTVIRVVFSSLLAREVSEVKQVR